MGAVHIHSDGAAVDGQVADVTAVVALLVVGGAVLVVTHLAQLAAHVALIVAGVVVLVLAGIHHVVLKVVQIGVEAVVGHLHGAHGGIRLIVAGAEGIDVAVDLGHQRVQIPIVVVNGGSGILISTVDVGAADHHIDVHLVVILVQCVQIVAAGGLLQIHPDSGLLIGGGIHIVAVHFTIEEVDVLGADVLLDHTQQIRNGGVDLVVVVGLIRGVGSIGGIGVHGHVGGAGVLTVHTVQTGDVIGIADLLGGQATHGHVGTVGAHVAQLIAGGSTESVALGIQLEERAFLTKGEVVVGAALLQLDVLLGAGSVNKIQLIQTIIDLNVHIHGVIHAGVGGAVVAAHDAGEIVHGALLGLVQTQLVGHAGDGIGNHAQRAGGNVGSDGGVGLHGNVGGSAAFAGVHGDAIGAGLGAQGLPSEGVGRLSQHDGDDAAIHGGGSVGGEGIAPAVDVLSLQAGAIDDNLGHTGILDDHGRGLVETSGIALAAVVAHVRGGRTLIVGDGDAVLLPHLLLGGVGGTVCLIGKVNGSGMVSGRHREGDDAAQQQNRQRHRDQFAHFHESVPPEIVILVG